MTLTISFGAWLIPAVITLCAVLAAGVVEWSDSKTPGNYVGALVSVLMWGAVAIVSLFSWLVWALLV